jgi:hypothetical protein
MHLEIDEDRVSAAVHLDGKTSSRVGTKRHSLRFTRIDRDFDVVAMEVENAPAVSGPNEFDRVASPHLKGLRSGAEPAVFNPQLEAAWFFADALRFTSFGKCPEGCHRNDDRQPQPHNLIAWCDVPPHTLFFHIPIAANSLDYP